MDVIKHQPKALEMILVKAGYSLREIRGEREVHRIREEPQGLVAAAGRVTPRSARLVAAGCLALGMLVAYETGLLSALAVSVALGVALHALGELEAEATETTHEIHRPGMDRREVVERVIQHDEHEQMKREDAESEAQAIQTKANAQQPTGGR